MQGEGAFKGFGGLLLAVLVVVAATFWHQTLFILRFVFGVIAINLQNFWDSVPHHFWPFSN